MQKTFSEADGFVFGKLFRCYEAVDGSVALGWRQVLTDGQEIDVGGPKVVHDL